MQSCVLCFGINTYGAVGSVIHTTWSTEDGRAMLKTVVEAEAMIEAFTLTSDGEYELACHRKVADMYGPAVVAGRQGMRLDKGRENSVMKSWFLRMLALMPAGNVEVRKGSSLDVQELRTEGRNSIGE